ncbi:hypothetical protein KKE60_01905 [Patescibacteria group bacterium]|nr:hypothetical protein [Patescibacteria group bacterium]MBU0922541.1 hypothetical protein [Patescibacteria group bacterium]MBU1066526.1 hypothetical protein [Patescibacteria group bacterium]MBU1844830.1 hypothetical protein [Patescibacteria group bacterium]
MIEVIFLLTFYLIVLPTNIEAYLDPGTGSYLTQIAIGFLVGGVYIGKRYLRQLISFFSALFQRKNRDDQEPKN